MISDAFSASTEAVAGIGVMRMTGNITRTASPSLTDAFQAACATGALRIGLDFDRVDYLNSTGIALVVSILAEAREAGLEVAAWGLSDHFLEIFEITRIVEFMQIYDNETAAIGLE